MSISVPRNAPASRLACLAVLLFTALPSLAGPQFVVAVQGYDAVAYFTERKARQGVFDYSYYWNGANWLFASEANRDRFAADPRAYAPQYDGFCSYAASQGYVAPGDAQTWRIVDGRLYLNYNTEAEALWQKDIPGNIAKGDENWPTLRAH